MTSIICSSSCTICGRINLQHNKLHQPVVDTQSTATHSTIGEYAQHNLPTQQLTNTQSTQPSTGKHTAYMDNAVSTVQCSTTLLTLTTTEHRAHRRQFHWRHNQQTRPRASIQLLQTGSRQTQSTSRGSVHLSHRSVPYPTQLQLFNSWCLSNGGESTGEEGNKEANTKRDTL